MAKTEFIRARVDEDLKANAEKLFNQLGISMTEAITLFLKQCEFHNGLPFEVKIPNEETLAAMKDGNAIIESGKGRFNNAKDLLRELKS